MGFFVLYAFAWAISEKRHAVQWRTVIGAISSL
ncbi:MAG: Na+ dependent nucleoside transporter N-terminal domain-containing protein, partial [Usitatibacteraceae bacterium]